MESVAVWGVRADRRGSFVAQIAELQAQQAPAAPAVPDDAAEIQKYAALMGQGLITQEEFDAKKRQILGI